MCRAADSVWIDKFKTFAAAIRDAGYATGIEESGRSTTLQTAGAMSNTV